MPFFHTNIQTAKPAKWFAFPPYHVESFPSGCACVCNKNGLNVLTFTDSPGAVLTTLEDAIKIAAAWNGESK